jgi:hypothetical protein
MLSILKPSLRAIILAFACTFSSSCGSDLGTTPDPSDPPVGSKISTQDIVGYFPAPKAGMLYVYVSTEKKGLVTLSNRAELEATEVKGTLVKLKLSVGDESKFVDVDTAKPPVLPAGGMNFEGREEVSVPAGSFKAFKLSFSQNNSSFNVWAVKGIGVIKTLEQRANSDMLTVELHQYRH